jgi:hypothetical protein
MASKLMLFGEIIGVDSENFMKYTSTVHDKMYSFLMLHIITTGILRIEKQLMLFLRFSPQV